jgi:hypothetical protein
MSAVAESFQVFCCRYQQIACAELPADSSSRPILGGGRAGEAGLSRRGRAAATRARFVRAVLYRRDQSHSGQDRTRLISSGRTPNVSQ